jgi:magnesium chelatase subunit D
VNPPTPREDAAMAACLLAVDPAGLGGAVLRARPGVERDRWLARFRALLPDSTPLRRLPPGIGDDALLGGLDLTATLGAGRPVARAGLLEASAAGVLVLPMAERIARPLAARLAAGQDAHGYAILALDEGLGEEEAPPAALLDRLAFFPDLSEPPSDPPYDARAIAEARARLAAVTVPDATIEAILATASAAGIVALRAPLLCVRAARAAAALAGRDAPDAEDAALAVRLVLGPRATVLPAPEDAPPEPPPPEPGEAPDRAEDPATEGRMEDVVQQAEAAVLPAQLLASLAAATLRARAPSSGRQGAERVSLKRGRPIGSRAGELRDGARLALLDTLRAAAPWQLLRPPPPAGRVAVRRTDFRIRRFRERSESSVIFVVDASGSSALHRLAEAKGAVELLLAECYARRDRVAVVAFRGQGAETLLPPTHSLVRAKRALAGLPGGGASPLAAGLDMALLLARHEKRAGRTPFIVALTDGRANVARDGTTGRAAAEEDALAVAKLLRAEAHPLLVVDTAPRPQPFAATLAAAAGGRSLALPQARAEVLAGAVRGLALTP